MELVILAFSLSKYNMHVQLKLFILLVYSSRLAFSFMENSSYVWCAKREGYPLIENSTWTVMTDGRGNIRFVLLKKLNSVSLTSTDNLNVRFFLYTRKTTATHEELITDDDVRLSSTTFNARLPLKVIIHGFLGCAFDEWVIQMKDNLLKVNDVNVICVDWSGNSNTVYYPSAVHATEPVGQLVARLLDFLAIRKGLSMKNVHLIGHSIGAHVAGVAGRRVQFGSVKRISGLDPALPLFDLKNLNVTLSTGDADFVDCIHTCGGFLGIYRAICHADFYPNGGRMNQPGCSYLDFGACSHSRAHNLYEESIIPTHEFNAYKCPSVSDDSDVVCNGTLVLMGYPTRSWDRGIFYVKTSSTYPYSDLS